MFDFLKKPIDAAKEKVNEYVEVRLEEVKLTTVEKASPIAASLIIGFIIVFLVFLVMLFLGFSLAEWLSDILQSKGLGYVSAAGVFFLMLLLMVIFFKNIAKPVTNKIARILYDAFH